MHSVLAEKINACVGEKAILGYKLFLAKCVSSNIAHTCHNHAKLYIFRIRRLRPSRIIHVGSILGENVKCMQGGSKEILE